jgi:hypothetical protein
MPSKNKKQVPGAAAIAQDASTTESKYLRQDMIRNAARFGVKPEVVAGALADRKESYFTIAEVTAAVEKFTGRKVE